MEIKEELINEINTIEDLYLLEFLLTFIKETKIQYEQKVWYTKEVKL